MPKYAFKEGEQKETTNCKLCKNELGRCYQEFGILGKGTKKERSYWRVRCPYLDKINREVGEKLSKIFR